MLSATLTSPMNAPAIMPPQPMQNVEERGMRTSREAREAQRAAKNGGAGGGGRYRRDRDVSPVDDYRYAGEQLEEPRSPLSDVALQDAMLAQAQQQRVVPVGQVSRNPGQRRPVNGNSTRGPRPQTSSQDSQGKQPQPPSYPGPPLDDGPIGPGRGYRRNPQRRPSDSEAPPSGPGGPVQHSHSPTSPPRSNGGPNANMQQQGRRPQSMMTDPQHQQQHGQRRPPSPGTRSVSGNSISRLQSPSVNKSVLHPLEQKMHEYGALMQDARAQISQLDEELRLLQDRKRQAEERFHEAKNKHDEYERQHSDVSRALRGELVSRPSTPPQLTPIMPRVARTESFEMRPESMHSTAKPSRFRMSFFK